MEDYSVGATCILKKNKVTLRGDSFIIGQRFIIGGQFASDHLNLLEADGGRFLVTRREDVEAENFWKVGDSCILKEYAVTSGGNEFFRGQKFYIKDIHCSGILTLQEQGTDRKLTIDEKNVLEVEEIMTTLKKCDLIIGSQIGNGKISISSNTKVQLGHDAASREAMRLAERYPEKDFLVLEVRGRASTAKVTYT